MTSFASIWTWMLLVVSHQMFHFHVRASSAGAGVAFLAHSMLHRHSQQHPEGFLAVRWSTHAKRFLASGEESAAEDTRNALSAALEKSVDPPPSSWWSNLETLPFDCTACGKCCKTKGSVWMSPDETQQAAVWLNLPKSDFISQYASHTLSSKGNNTGIDDAWIKLRNTKEEACVFLDSDTNQCSIYPARPAQCSTYPFWSEIMASEQSWNDEVRSLDDAPLGPYWTLDSGGCEGMKRIGTAEGTNTIAIAEASIQLEEYQWKERRFPFTSKPKPVVRANNQKKMEA